MSADDTSRDALVERVANAYAAALLDPERPSIVQRIVDGVVMPLVEERDQLLASIAELAPSDEVLVEGSFFQRDDLPRILGNFMRSSDEYARDAKRFYIERDAAIKRAEAAEQERDRLAAEKAKWQAEALREAQDELVRRDAFTERSLRILDELIEKGTDR